MKDSNTVNNIKQNIGNDQKYTSVFNLRFFDSQVLKIESVSFKTNEILLLHTND